MMKQTDVELVTLIARKETSAMDAFYDRFAPRILGWLVQWMGSRADAEDVLQEVFWQVWNEAERFDERRSPPLGWLYTIARTRAIDQMKSQTRRKARDRHVPDAMAELPHDNLERSEETFRVQKALQALPETQRNAITLVFYSGMTHVQVAEEESIPIGTAKTRIRLGILRLQSLLENQEGRTDHVP